jgi:hypothetical protein
MPRQNKRRNRERSNGQKAKDPSAADDSSTVSDEVKVRPWEMLVTLNVEEGNRSIITTPVVLSMTRLLHRLYSSTLVQSLFSHGVGVFYSWLIELVLKAHFPFFRNLVIAQSTTMRSSGPTRLSFCITRWDAKYFFWQSFFFFSIYRTSVDGSSFWNWSLILSVWAPFSRRERDLPLLSENELLPSNKVTFLK